MIAGKVWGMTEAIEKNVSIEFHRAILDAGGVCSKHRHIVRWNGFFVERGKVLVRVWQTDYELVDETILGEGEYTKVPPGLYHQFECLEPATLFELYWVEMGATDIERESPGYLSS